MLKQFLARIGLGGVVVDTVLESGEVPVGGALRGVVRIDGGEVLQRIDAIHLELITTCLVEGRDDERAYAEVVVAGMRAAARVEVGPGEHIELPFAIEVPEHTPLSIGSTRTALRTRLEIPGAIDKQDADAVAILPSRAMASVLEGLEQAGFRLVEAEVEHAPRRKFPFVQELDFEPTRLADWGVKELEIAFRPVGRGAFEAHLVVDRRGGLFRLGGESSHRFRVPAAGMAPGAVAAAIRELIARRS